MPPKELTKGFEPLHNLWARLGSRKTGLNTKPHYFFTEYFSFDFLCVSFNTVVPFYKYS